MKLVIPLETDLTEQEQEDLRYLFQDALWDFVRSRPNDYVEQRYPSWTPEMKAEKQRQVDRRVALAEKLKAAAFDLQIED